MVYFERHPYFIDLTEFLVYKILSKGLSLRYIGMLYCVI